VGTHRFLLGIEKANLWLTHKKSHSYFPSTKMKSSCRLEQAKQFIVGQTKTKKSTLEMIL